MAAYNPVDGEVACYLCHEFSMADGDKLFLMNCCKEGIHRSCLKKKVPDWTNDKVVPCPKCHLTHSKATEQVIQRSKFTVAQMETIERCFNLHYPSSRVPMTQEEMKGLDTARHIPGPTAMRHVSHRIFLVGMCFWFGAKKERVCDWEDIGCRLSLKLPFFLLSEMQGRYQRKVEREQKGDAFHHFLEYLHEVAYEDNEAVRQSAVVQSCGKQGCKECNDFIALFDGERCSHLVGMANRKYFYERVEMTLYRQFMRLVHRKNEQCVVCNK